MTQNKLPHVTMIDGYPQVIHPGQMWVDPSGNVWVIDADGNSKLADTDAVGLRGKKQDILFNLDAILAKYADDDTESFLLDLIHELYLRYYDRQEQDDDSDT